jgi:hypothetical protein
VTFWSCKQFTECATGFCHIYKTNQADFQRNPPDVGGKDYQDFYPDKVDLSISSKTHCQNHNQIYEYPPDTHPLQSSWSPPYNNLGSPSWHHLFCSSVSNLSDFLAFFGSLGNPREDTQNNQQNQPLGLGCPVRIQIYIVAQSASRNLHSFDSPSSLRSFENLESGKDIEPTIVGPLYLSRPFLGNGRLIGADPRDSEQK